MKKFIVLIFIIIIAGGAYVFLNKKEKEPRCQDGFRFVPSSQTCEPVDKPKEEEVVIDFSKVTLKIPETKIEIQLEANAASSKYVALYSDPKDPSVKGSVSLDPQKSIQYSSEFVLAPFVLETGGSGQFVYLGLFDTGTQTHLSSIFIGDRLTIGSINILNEKIKVNFKTRLDSESFAVEPSIPAQLVLEIKDNKLSEIMKLQNADYGDVEIKSLSIDNSASSTLTLKGAIPGSWFFEAIAQFKIIDNQYNEIAIGNIQALSDWMTTQRVPFELKFTTATLNYIGKATLIIHSENVQGEEEGERMVRKIYIPIELK